MARYPQLPHFEIDQKWPHQIAIFDDFAVSRIMSSSRASALSFRSAGN